MKNKHRYRVRRFGIISKILYFFVESPLTPLLAVGALLLGALAVALLPRFVGCKRAAEMIFGGASLSAAEAERIGLISRAVPDDKLEAEAAALIQRFQEGSAPVLQCARRGLTGAFDQPFDEAVRNAEDVYLNQLMATDDAAEGLKAVLERRRPSWKGR